MLISKTNTRNGSGEHIGIDITAHLDKLRESSKLDYLATE